MYTQESSVHNATTTPAERPRPFDGLFTFPAVRARRSGKSAVDNVDPFADVEGGFGEEWEVCECWACEGCGGSVCVKGVGWYVFMRDVVCMLGCGSN